MTIIGILIISMSFLIFILTLIFAKLRDHIKLILPITIAFGFLGYGLIIYERVVELTLPGGVSVKTAAQQTVEDAKFIRETRDTVFAQSKTIGLVVQQADELSRKITDFDLIMNKSQEELNKTRETLSAQSNAIGSVVLRANELSDKITGFESFIQSSQKEINSILETLNPYTKPIMTANCRMVLEAQSSYQEKFKNKIPRLISGGNGGLWFVRGNDTILALTSVSGRETPTSEDSAAHSIRRNYHYLPCQRSRKFQ